MFKKFVSVSMAALLLAACQTGPDGRPMNTMGNKEGVGTLLGAVGGAAVGSQFGGGTGRVVGIAAGTLLGAALGNQVGASLDRADMAYYNQTSQRALEEAPSGQALPWRNPESGNYGTITPSNVYRGSSGEYCREYQQTITVGGKTSKGYGTACRQPDGSWRIVQ